MVDEDGSQMIEFDEFLSIIKGGNSVSFIVFHLNRYFRNHRHLGQSKQAEEIVAVPPKLRILVDRAVQANQQVQLLFLNSSKS